MPDSLLKLFLLIPFPILVGIIMYTVNYWNATELEKKLMTKFQRLKIIISITLFISIVGTAILLFIINDGNSKVTPTEISGTFIILVFLSLIATFFVTISLKILTFKTTFYIYLDEDSERWKIEKVIKGRELLLSQESNRLQIIGEWCNKIILMESKPIWKWQLKLYESFKVFNTVVIVLNIMFLGCLILLLSNSEDICQYLIYFLLLLFLLSLIISLELSLVLYESHQKNLKKHSSE